MQASCGRPRPTKIRPPHDAGKGRTFCGINNEDRGQIKPYGACQCKSGCAAKAKRLRAAVVVSELVPALFRQRPVPAFGQSQWTLADRFAPWTS
jgi:hypothetical protein